MAINLELAKQRNLSENAITAIEAIHEGLHKFLLRPTMYAKAENCAEIVHGVEYTLQMLWGFPADRKFHRYEFDLEGCLCNAYMDNRERIGYTETRIYNTNCPFHGN